MKKICNQAFVKDSHRDKRYSGTMRCICCMEESHLDFKFPFLVSKMIDQLRAFGKVHAAKGCNDVRLSAPDWASGVVDIAIV